MPWHRMGHPFPFRGYRKRQLKYGEAWTAERTPFETSLKA